MIEVNERLLGLAMVVLGTASLLLIGEISITAFAYFLGACLIFHR